MPLKHRTETGLVVLLGAVIVFTGILLAWIPPFPEGALAWTMILFATLIYPLLFASFLKRNRAEYEFRRLHLFPFFMALLWGIAQGISLLFGAPWGMVFTILTFLWSFPLVALGMLLLLWFCLTVVRRASVRAALLSGMFGCFLVFALFSHLLDWNSVLRGNIFDDTFLTENVLTSFFSGEMSYESGSVIIGSTDGISSLASSSSDTGNPRPPRGDVVPPPKLPRSGGEIAFLVLTMGGLYCGVLQKRAGA